jgi:two-component SAPR family response regulator
MAIADALEDAGYRTVGPFASASDALSSLERVKPDYAILDVTLRDGTCIELARDLRSRGVPYLLHTGWPPHAEIAQQLPDAPWLEKPVRYDDLVRALEALTEGATC